MKNEDAVKNMIVSAHKRGTCDSDGASIKSSDGRSIAKPKTYSSASRTYVYRDGKAVLKERN